MSSERDDWNSVPHSESVRDRWGKEIGRKIVITPEEMKAGLKRAGGGAEVVKEAEESAGVTISGEAVGIIGRLRAELDAAERVLTEIADIFICCRVEEVRIFENPPSKCIEDFPDDRDEWCAGCMARAYFAARREDA